MQKIIYFLLSSLIVFSACSSNKQQTLTIAAAANTQYAMGEIKTAFETQFGQEITLIFGSSGKLTAQILESAPYDVFISADLKYPQSIYDQGFAVGDPGVYAQGALVLWTLNPNLTPDAGLEVLLSEKVKKIAMANPQTAPYGVATEELLRNVGIYDQVARKLVFGESISQTNQYLTTHAAEIGFTAKSVVLSKELQGKGQWIDLDLNQYRAIDQGVVLLKKGVERHGALAKQFYEFLFSDTARKIFEKYGYLMPK